MTIVFRSIRREILTPKRSETLLSVRSFHTSNVNTRIALEDAGGNFIDGFAIAAESSQSVEAVANLGRVVLPFRGFAFEGAAMAMAIRDALSLRPGRLIKDLNKFSQDSHIYMVNVGAGWAMGRLPKFLWKRALMGCDDSLLVWLTLDGFGFHEAYFHTSRTVQDYHYPSSLIAWPFSGQPRDREHVFDQGVGRALWFVEGGRCTAIVDTIARFPAERRSDLWAGVGLAVTYAGGVDIEDVIFLKTHSGNYLGSFLQGSIFAAEARCRAGTQTAYTERVVQALMGINFNEVHRIAQESIPADSEILENPYQEWRARISESILEVISSKSVDF